MREIAPLVDHAGIVATAARLADECRKRPPLDSHAFPADELRALTLAGLLSSALPSDCGGAGVGIEPGMRGCLLPVLREVGRANLPLGRVFEGHVNALLLLHAFGSRQQIAHAAELVVTEGHVFGVWNTGPPNSPRLTPLSDGTYRMSGAKTFATGVSRIDQAIVTAGLPNGGWQMCLIPLAVVETQIRRDTWTPLGMEATESYAVDFPDVILPSHALIGEPGDYYAEPAFTGGSLRFCAVQLGAAQALFDAMCGFIEALGRGGDLFQLQRLGEVAVLIESGKQWLAQAARWLDTDFADAGSLAVRARMMRIATEEICTRVMQLVELSVGARGLSSSEPFARTLRDLRMYLRQAGFDQAFVEVGRHALQERLLRG